MNIKKGANLDEEKIKKLHELYSLYIDHESIKKNFFGIKLELEKSLNRIERFGKENPEVLMYFEKEEGGEIVKIEN